MGLADCEGHILRVNPSFCRMTGYAEAELRGRTPREITHPEDREGDCEKLDKLLRGEIFSYQREKRYLHKNGSVVWASVTAWLVRDESGHPLCLSGQVHELTERKAKEEKLKQQILREAFADTDVSELLRSKTGARLLKVVNAIYQKQTLLEKMVSEPTRQKIPFTKREQEVATLLAKGRTSKQIARTLAISPRTVEVHRAAVTSKMRPASPSDLPMSRRAQPKHL